MGSSAYTAWMLEYWNTGNWNDGMLESWNVGIMEKNLTSVFRMKAIFPLFIGLFFLKGFNQLFYRPRHKGKPHLAKLGVF
jgi:hypothetical protein